MRIDREYHHFKGEHLSRSEWVERFVIDQLVHSDIADDERESSRAWELMHSSTCKAFMHVLAEKRNLDVELARVAGALHDYYVIKTGKYKNHARFGAPLVGEILASHGGFSDLEIGVICETVENHSDKQVYSNCAHVELIKDVDVFDCSLYHGTEFYYLTRKPLPVCHEYFTRILKVRGELGMPLPDSYRCLSREDNGFLEDMGAVILSEYANHSPTPLILSLWALASAPEARNWPLLMVHYRNGTSRWFAPKNFLLTPTRADNLPDWNSIRRIRATSRERASRLKSAGSTQVRDLLHRCRDILGPAWVGLRFDAHVRESAAVLLKDFECDPLADEKIEHLLRGRVHKMLDAEQPEHNQFPPGWELDPKQMAAVDELSRLRVLAELRGELVQHTERALSAASERVGCDLVWQFPSEALDCEKSPSARGPGGEWLAVIWPRFERLEFTVGAEAEDRFNTLTEYFTCD